MRVIVYAIGGRLQAMPRMHQGQGLDVVAFMDGDPRKQGAGYCGAAIVGPEALGDLEYDYILVFSTHFSSIRTSLVQTGVSPDRILLVDGLADAHVKDTSQLPPYDRSALGYIEYARSLKNRTPSILSNNCWGGIVSQAFAIPYFSPFVGIDIPPAHFVAMLENPERYLSADVRQVDDPDTCPVGMVHDARLHFRHSASFNEAVTKWNKRRRRIDWDNLFVKLSLRSPDELPLVDRFNALPYENRICFTTFDPQGAPGCLWLKELETGSLWGAHYNEVTVSRLHLDIVRWLDRHEVAGPVL